MVAEKKEKEKKPDFDLINRKAISKGNNAAHRMWPYWKGLRSKLRKLVGPTEATQDHVSACHVALLPLAVCLG